MRFRNQTPLVETDLSDEQRALLHSLWIESIEEIISMNYAVGDSHKMFQKTGLKALYDSSINLRSISANRLEQVSLARPGGGLGCLVDEQTMQDFTSMGRLRPARAMPLHAFEAELPTSIKLMDRMPPIRNQGERGTCVAFAFVALREFLTESQDDLSEQFLYWACKQLDGNPGSGTYLQTATTSLSQYGVCREDVWPYNSRQQDDEGQGPPPDGAIDDARRYKLDSTRTVEANLVVNYKDILAGGVDQIGMPIAFGTLVFGSWFMSAETHRTGKITMPLPGEEPIGGHAWCIVGYVDDESVPGGGYFIVRNSWGASWAADSIEAPGHAMMPYEYVELYAIGAFTGTNYSKNVASDVKAEDLKSCVRVLDRDDHEELQMIPRAGRLLKVGTRVLEDRFNSEVFREASRENEEEFLRRDLTWTDDSWQQVWFKKPSKFTSETTAKLDLARTGRERFVSSIQENLVASKGTIFPRLNLPWWFGLIPFGWEPKIEKVTSVADLTEEIAKYIEDHSESPENLAWPNEWQAILTGLNTVKVFSIDRGSNYIHVVCGFITPIMVRKNEDPGISSMDQALIDALKKAYSTWCSTQKDSTPILTFYTIGSMECPTAKSLAVASANHWLAVSCPDSDDRWKTHTPRRFGDRPAIRDFVDMLKPVTTLERVSRIKDCVDALILEGGNVTIERVMNKCGYRSYRKSVVRRAFLTMQGKANDSYRIEKITNGQFAIRKAKAGERIRIEAGSFRSNFVRRHGLRLTGAGLGLGFRLVHQELHMSGIAGFIVPLFLLYLTSCLQEVLNRRANESKE